MGKLVKSFLYSFAENLTVETTWKFPEGGEQRVKLNVSVSFLSRASGRLAQTALKYLRIKTEK